MAFWGAFIEPGKPYTLRLDDDNRRLRISQATLGLCRGMWNFRSVVRCAIGSQPPIAICSLSAEIHCCPLDLELEECDDVVFSVVGQRGCHLAGYYLPPSMGDKKEIKEDIPNTEQQVYQKSYQSLPMKGCQLIQDNRVVMPQKRNDCSSNGHTELEDELEIQNDSIFKSREIIEKTKISGERVADKIVDEVLERAEAHGTCSDRSSKRIDHVILNTEQESCSTKKKGRKKGIVQDKPGDGFGAIIGNIATDCGLEEDATKAMNEGNCPPAIAGCQISIIGKASKKSPQLATEMCHSHERKNAKKRKFVNQGNNFDSNKSCQLETENQSSLVSPKEINMIATSSIIRTSSDGMTIEVLEKGKPDGKVASQGKKVKIYCVLKLRDSGYVVGSNFEGAPYEFCIGEKKMVKGVHIGIEGMRVGEKRRLTIPPSLGFGEKAKPSIPSGSWLQYDIDLVDIYE